MIRDLVNDYEALIDRLKLAKGKATSGDTALLKSIMPYLNKLAVKTEKVFQEYNTYKNMNKNELAIKYLITYYSYLQLVSIPYTIDILNDIKEILAKNNNEELVIEIDILMDKYKKLANLR